MGRTWARWILFRGRFILSPAIIYIQDKLTDIGEPKDTQLPQPSSRDGHALRSVDNFEYVPSRSKIRHA